MGCASSKPLEADDFEIGVFFSDGACPNHVVSLTSTTYGVLNLDRDDPNGKKRKEVDEEEREVIKRECRRSPPPADLSCRSRKSFEKEGPLEVIDARELMEDLDNETPFWTPLKNSTKLHLCTPVSKVSPSPKKQRRNSAGKENASVQRESKRWDVDLRRILRPFSPSANSKPMGQAPEQTMPKSTLINAGKTPRDSNGSASRRSLTPFFDPALLASLEREHLQEGEKIKKITLLPRNRKVRDSSLLLQSYEEKCPRGGTNAVVLYTTTLRGIRKTFEDCNAARSALESYNVQIMERDISMDSGYREELRLLMGVKEVKVPAVFVKGRLIGGAAEVLKLEEEGKLELLLEGLPKAAVLCEGCAGVRFVLCRDCNGSCKVLDEEQEKTVKCEVCNENGLIHCPMCC